MIGKNDEGFYIMADGEDGEDGEYIYLEFIADADRIEYFYGTFTQYA